MRLTQPRRTEGWTEARGDHRRAPRLKTLCFLHLPPLPRKCSVGLSVPRTAALSTWHVAHSRLGSASLSLNPFLFCAELLDSLRQVCLSLSCLSLSASLHSSLSLLQPLRWGGPPSLSQCLPADTCQPLSSPLSRPLSACVISGLASVSDFTFNGLFLCFVSLSLCLLQRGSRTQRGASVAWISTVHSASLSHQRR